MVTAGCRNPAYKAYTPKTSGAGTRQVHVRSAYPAAAGPPGSCQRGCGRKDWLTLRSSWVTVAAGWSQCPPCRPCPPPAHSTGIWRSLTVNSGRSHTDLTCAIGVGFRLSGLPGHAFQARDAGCRPHHSQLDTLPSAATCSAVSVTAIQADAGPSTLIVDSPRPARTTTMSASSAEGLLSRCTTPFGT